MAIRLGLGLPQLRQYDLAQDVTDVARTAEQIGYDSVWVYERALVPTAPDQGLYGIPGLPWPDWYRGMAHPLVTLTLAAAVTERVRLGTGIVVAPLHGPFQFAKALATLDAASGGRVVAGLGTGWSTDEFAAASFLPYEERGAALDEVLGVCRAVWGPDPVSYEGRVSTIAPAVVGPKPVRPIPVLLAAGSTKALTRVVDRADGWIPVAMGARAYAAGWRRLQDIAAERGRSRPIERVVRVNTRYSAKAYDGSDRQPFQGSADQIVEDLAAYAEVGMDEVLVDLQTAPRDVRELKDAAAEVYEKARAAGL
ncbi:LLM class F420-dependent oxidoreductase [Streptomyces actuosus]|uniref:LLM class F420-dependent oxidoreductase n=1 Tax=Streptomyces actuosus TaxID=1885 RepID=A0ABS2VXG8_STRAS|nr:LLM class F420-dependent oxidoreductase [Streptomyces actuosus]MBN0047706.1 LLM class F420-dependent oxidoreductase [Streptomyces actuosus]